MFRSKKYLFFVIPFILFASSMIGVSLFTKDTLFEQVGINGVNLYLFRYDRYIANLSSAFNVESFNLSDMFSAVHFDRSSVINGFKSVVNIIILIINLVFLTPLQFAMFTMNIVFSALYIGNVEWLQNVMEYMRIPYLTF